MEAYFERELSLSDLVVLGTGQPASVRPLAKLRNSHHHLARILAEGKDEVEASRLSGYSVGRINTLLDDPAFQELIAHYKSQVDEIQVDVNGRLELLGLDTMEELHERLLETPEKFRVVDLHEQLKLTMDRVGFGPKSTINQNIRQMVLTDDSLNAIKLEAERRRIGAVRLLSPGGAPHIDSIPVGMPTPPASEESPRRQGEGTDVREEIREDAQLELPLEESSSRPMARVYG